MESETTYKKGLKLEELFARHMKDKLGYDKIRVRAHLPGQDNAKGTEADILARKSNDIKEMAEYLVLPSLLIGVASALLAFFDIISDVSIISLCSDIIFPISAVVFIISFIVNQLLNWEWTWVECKNLKGQANINQVSKLVREYEDYNNVENKEFNITNLIFVSANGFIENAIKYAEKKDIKCYQLNDKEEFTESKYWS